MTSNKRPAPRRGGKFKVGDNVRVSLRPDATVYQVTWIGAAFDCQIAERREDGTLCAAQDYDTDLLYRA